MPKLKERTSSLAQFTVRPKRIAYIIDSEVSNNDLLSLLVQNTWMWGGFYNLFVPHGKGTVSNAYMQILRQYDPDHIVFCGNIARALRKQIFTYILPFSSIDLKHFSSQDPINYMNCVYTPQLYAREVTRHRSGIPSTVRIPEISINHRYHHNLLVQAGLVDERLAQFLTSNLSAQKIVFDPQQSLREYLESVHNLLGQMYPLRLTAARLSKRYSLRSHTDVIISLGDVSDIESVCHFWNIRMNASDSFIGPNHEAILFLPPNSLKGINNLQALADHINTHYQAAQSITLSGPSKLLGKARRIKERLEPLISKPIETRMQYPEIELLSLTESVIAQEISWIDRKALFHVPHPSFDLELIRSDDEWIVDCAFEDRSASLSNYHPPHRQGQLALLMRETYGNSLPESFSGGPWRLSKKTVSCKASQKERFVGIKLPSSREILLAVPREYGYEAQITDKCGYIASTIDIIARSGLQKTIHEECFRSILEAMSDGNPLSLNQILVIAKPGRNSDRIVDFMSDLLASGGVFRGISCRCSNCGLLGWYRIDATCETMSCLGCAQEFQPPIKLEYTFALNHLLRTAIKQGGLPVIYLKRILRSLCRNTLYFLPGITVAKEKSPPSDIDVIASCDGNVVCAECKTLKHASDGVYRNEIIPQLERDYLLACNLHCNMFCISIMSKTIHRSVKAFANRKNSRKHGVLVVIVDLEDMERGFIPESRILPSAPGRDRVPVSIDQLLHYRKDHKLFY